MKAKWVQPKNGREARVLAYIKRIYARYEWKDWPSWLWIMLMREHNNRIDLAQAIIYLANYKNLGYQSSIALLSIYDVNHGAVSILQPNGQPKIFPPVKASLIRMARELQIANT